MYELFVRVVLWFYAYYGTFIHECRFMRWDNFERCIDGKWSVVMYCPTCYKAKIKESKDARNYGSD